MQESEKIRAVRVGGIVKIQVFDNAIAGIFVEFIENFIFVE